VKIDTSRITVEGMILQEVIPPSVLELEVAGIEFRGPIQARAQVSKITNAVTVELDLRAGVRAGCSRCLKDLEFELNKSFRLNFRTDNSQPVVDLNPDIREEIILGYPMKLLCAADCKGLCTKCGRNLNEGGCNCATT